MIDRLEITFMPLCYVGTAENVGKKYTCWTSYLLGESNQLQRFFFKVCVSLSNNKKYFE